MVAFLVFALWLWLTISVGPWWVGVIVLLLAVLSDAGHRMGTTERAPDG